MKKVIRDGKVAVLYSPGYGAGWSTWSGNTELLFCPEIVNLVEQNQHKKIPDIAKELFGDEIYCGGGEDLVIEWVPVGTRFRVDEYDGSESIVYLDQDDYVVA